ncbi:hypothetical protein COLO4_18390 [Corchorus olitorius]|uniref:Uncharacterized protein n=1 Tax=Corchorus olitorius TaxID=93759 RepID=A0A1R3J992_9ROSI|nr:hypothetical protein COLO4_18390 [Corchorus olitorius]
MELQNSSSTRKRNQTMPPRRGQVKIRIIKSLVRLVASITSAAMEKRRKGGESGAALSSCSDPNWLQFRRIIKLNYS